MIDDVPKIAVTLVRSGLFLPVFLIISGFMMLPELPLLATFQIAIAVIVCLPIIRILSTALTPDGVSQLTWRGRVHLRWAAVQIVKKNANSLILTGAAARIVIVYQSYYDSDAALRYIDSRLPQPLRN